MPSVSGMMSSAAVARASQTSFAVSTANKVSASSVSSPSKVTLTVCRDAGRAGEVKIVPIIKPGDRAPERQEPRPIQVTVNKSGKTVILSSTSAGQSASSIPVRFISQEEMAALPQQTISLPLKTSTVTIPAASRQGTTTVLTLPKVSMPRQSAQVVVQKVGTVLVRVEVNLINNLFV